MLDILMPISVKDLPLAVSEIQNPDGIVYAGAIPSLVRDTDVPFRIYAVVDGGTSEDVAVLRRYMPTLQDWALDQNTAVVGISDTLSRMLIAARNQFVAVVPPYIWVDDPKWFGKMQVVFTKDPHTMMVGADVPNTISSTMPPQKLDHKTHPVSPFFLSSLNAVRNALGADPLRGEDYWREYSRRALELGGTRWVASGVRYGDVHASEAARTFEPAPSSDR